MNKDIRWKQRFSNFERAYLFLDKAVEKGQYDKLQAAGLLQSFEFTFELGWKTLKDYLEAGGFSLATPREVIKQAFQSGLIVNGHIWIKMLNKRNQLSHCYDEKQAEEAVRMVREELFSEIAQVYETLKEKHGDK